jgi:hypothetical protein
MIERVRGWSTWRKVLAVIALAYLALVLSSVIAGVLSGGAEVEWTW